MLEVYFMWTESDLNVEIWKMYAKVFRRQWLWLVYKLSVIIIITNEKIKAMLLWKRCRGTLQDYNMGEISKCQSKLWTNRKCLQLVSEWNEGGNSSKRWW